MDSSNFSHVKDDRTPHMVDVSTKNATTRTARASARVDLGEEIAQRLVDNDLHLPKGPVFQTAILAGIMAAKKTADLIPLCHIITEASTAIHMASPLAVTSILPFMKTTVHVFPKPIFQK